jgi:hypothetical protein
MARGGADTAKDGSKDPAKQGRIAQLRAVFTMTRQADPAVTWWMLGTVVATLVVAYGIGWAVGQPIYVMILGVPMGVMLALIVMARRAERAAYARFTGQTGASAMAFQNLRKGWNITQEPVAMDPRTQDLVFRLVGRPGVVLVTEGPSSRVAKLAETERKRINRVLGANVPVTIVQCGDGEGQIALRKLSGHLMRIKPAITKTEVSEVSKRLRALGGLKPPLPKGIDPTRVRPDRRATRGR